MPREITLGLYNCLAQIQNAGLTWVAWVIHFDKEQDGGFLCSASWDSRFSNFMLKCRLLKF